MIKEKFLLDKQNIVCYVIPQRTQEKKEKYDEKNNSDRTSDRHSIHAYRSI